MRRPALIGLAVVVADRLSKLIVRGAMVYGESVKISDSLRITYVENTGTAWGFLAFGAYSNYLFLVVNLMALFYLAVNYGKFAVDRASAAGWALIVAGALGNLGDRIFVGAVVDFIDVRILGYGWPVFNVADSSLTAGGILLFFSIVRNAVLRRRPAAEI